MEFGCAWSVHGAGHSPDDVMAKRRRRFGQIVVKKTGKVVARWHERGRLRERGGWASKAQADRFLARKQLELGEARALDLPDRAPLVRIRFESLVAQYVDLFQGTKRETSILREQQVLESTAVPVFRGRYVHQIRTADIERFLQSRSVAGKLKPATRNRMLSYLRGLFRRAIALGHAHQNPAVGILRGKEELRGVPFLDLEQQEQLVRNTSEPLRWLVQLVLDTGLRMGEVLRLCWRDCDLRRGWISVSVSKTKPRAIPVTKRGKSALTQVRTRFRQEPPRVPDLVFPGMAEYSSRGEPRLRFKYRAEWDAARRCVGFSKLRLHDLRHVWAATCARAGVPLNELMELGGWTTLTMVSRYSRHVPANTVERARARLESLFEAEVVTQNATDLSGI